jgi:hypothetical protein
MLNLLLWLALQPCVPDVADDTDHRRRAPARSGHPNALAHGLFAGKELSRRGFAEDERARRRLGVALVEPAAGKQGIPIVRK